MKALHKKRPAEETGTPSHFTEEDGHLTVKERFFCDGVALLDWEADFPAPVVGKTNKERGLLRIAATYRQMAAAADAHVRTCFLDRLRRAYEENDDPRKRFRHIRLSFSITHRVTYAEGGLFSVRREAVLRRGGRTLYTRWESEVWDTKTGRACPLSRLRRAGFSLPPRPKEKAARGGFYIEGGTVCFLPPENS